MKKTEYIDPYLGQPGTDWKRAEAYGMDMSLIRANLNLSVAERLRRHDVALRTMMVLRASVMERDGKPN
ncbi:MAG: hypothetical protein PHP44_07545 [Kiritimatiellae bacterium]|nr:hypothetical protein [Kiritimatiellia bacterium]